MNLYELSGKYWWVLLVLIFPIFYKFILRVFFGMVIVPQNRIGLVTKKFVMVGANRELPDGRIIICYDTILFDGFGFNLNLLTFQISPL